MVTITGLTLYPIKSCAGIAVREAVLGLCGLEHRGIFDREWMVVDEGGVFITQRDYPALARAQVSIGEGALAVAASDLGTLRVELDGRHKKSKQRSVRVWDDSLVATDEGEEAANWFSRLLDRWVRLVRFDEGQARLSSKVWTKGREARIRFSDAYPLLLISEASLADLNSRWRSRGHAAHRGCPNFCV